MDGVNWGKLSPIQPCIRRKWRAKEKIKDLWEREKWTDKGKIGICQNIIVKRG